MDREKRKQRKSEGKRKVGQGKEREDKKKEETGGGRKAPTLAKRIR